MAPVVTDKPGIAEDALLLDEQQWDEQFAGSSDVLENLYDEITADQQAGRTLPITA